MTQRGRVEGRRRTMTSPLVRLAIVAIAATATVAGCGSDDDAMVSIQGEERRLVTIEPAGDDVDLLDFTASAMGGVRFSVDPDHHLHMPGDTIVVSVSDPADEDGWEVASIGLVTQTADGVAVESVDQVIDLIAATPTAEVSSTGTAIEVLDHRLAGYDIRADPSTRDLLVFSADRIGSPPMALFSYFPNARIFLADTPAGVLVAASAEADDVSNIETIDTALGTLIASIELTGAALEAPLPRGESLAPDEIQESEARDELNPDGPPALDAPFTPVEPGTYQVSNFGTTFTLELAEDWHVQPNFPGFVVLTSPGSGGPGDRDLVFLSGIVDVVPIGAGPVAAGEPIPVVGADDLLTALGPDLEISGVEEVELGGVGATRFDVRIPAESTCTQDEPCEWAFRTSSGVVKQLRSTHAHRIWWIEDGAEGPSMIVAMTTIGDDFIARATDAVDTIAFN